MGRLVKSRFPLNLDADKNAEVIRYYQLGQFRDIKKAVEENPSLFIAHTAANTWFNTPEGRQLCRRETKALEA